MLDVDGVVLDVDTDVELYVDDGVVLTVEVVVPDVVDVDDVVVDVVVDSVVDVVSANAT